MKRIFITGMSGTGKSSVIAELRLRGFTAIDTDYENWCELSTGIGEPEWLLREDKMHQFLTTPLTAPLFVSGCCSNQGKFYPLFDYKILVSAPLDVMLDRVAQRTGNPYGKSEEERNDICRNFETIQSLLQASADVEIDSSTMSVSEIADFLVRLGCGEQTVSGSLEL